MSEYSKEMKLPLILLAPKAANALGATLGQDCLSAVDSALRLAESIDHALVLDFSGVQAVNASFLKATVYWSIQCGQADAQQKTATSSEDWAVRPLRLFPAVTNCSQEVEEDIVEFFCGRGIPIVRVDEYTADELIKGRLLGTLDPVLRRTLSSLVELSEGTAADLAAQSNDKITVNGWNNRLADLHFLRLTRRRKQGKFWLYSSIVNDLSLWD